MSIFRFEDRHAESTCPIRKDVMLQEVLKVILQEGPLGITFLTNKETLIENGTYLKDMSCS